MEKRLLPVGTAFVDPSEVIVIHEPWDQTVGGCVIETRNGSSFSLRGVSPAEATKALGLA